MAPSDSSHLHSYVCYVLPATTLARFIGPGVQPVLLAAAQQEGQGTMWIYAFISERPEPSGRNWKNHNFQYFQGGVSRLNAAQPPGVPCFRYVLASA